MTMFTLSVVFGFACFLMLIYSLLLIVSGLFHPCFHDVAIQFPEVETTCLRKCVLEFCDSIYYRTGNIYCRVTRNTGVCGVTQTRASAAIFQEVRNALRVKCGKSLTCIQLFERFSYENSLALAWIDLAWPNSHRKVVTMVLISTGAANLIMCNDL